MARVVLLTGGNSGDVKRTLQAAQQLVNAKVGAVLRCSHRYETKPWGFDADGVFSNQALEVSTDLLPLEVLDAVQAIERELGRNRAAYQGVEGAFAHIALRALFPHAEAVSYATWDEVFDAVEQGDAA